MHQLNELYLPIYINLDHMSLLYINTTRLQTMSDRSVAVLWWFHSCTYSWSSFFELACHGWTEVLQEVLAELKKHPVGCLAATTARLLGVGFTHLWFVTSATKGCGGDTQIVGEARKQRVRVVGADRQVPLVGYKLFFRWDSSAISHRKSHQSRLAVKGMFALGGYHWKK